MTLPYRTLPHVKFDQEALDKSNGASRLVFFRAFSEGKSIEESWLLAEHERNKVYEKITGVPFPGGVTEYGGVSNLEDEP